MATNTEMEVDEIKTNDEKADLSSAKTDKDGEHNQNKNIGCPENESDFKRPIFRPIKSEQEDPTSSSSTAKKDKHGDITGDDSTNNNDKDDSAHDKGSKINPASETSGSALSPAELAKQMRSAIPYKEPTWGGLASRSYSFDVLKNGSIVDNVDLSDRSYYIFGRLPICDVTLEHPSLSRYHACIQNCAIPTERYEAGWYLYDLNSTHGTWINKVRVQPKVYHRIRVGHVIKFGGGTRLFILQGPDDDQEEVSKLKMQREKHKWETELFRQDDVEEDPNEAITRDDRCMLRIDMANVTDNNQENPFAPGLELDESFYIDDPKKALKNYLDREGFDAPKFETVNEGPEKFRCSIELPIDDANGRPIVAVATVTGKKREAVEACALEACRILDRQGVLRAATHESRKRKKKNWEDNNFYNSDKDAFLDRTGTIKKKREQMIKKAGKLGDKTGTYESLSEKHVEVIKEIQEIEEKLEKAKKDAAAIESSDDMDALDALDAYMNSIKSGGMDMKTQLRLKRRLLQLQPQEQHLRNLLNSTWPASLPQFEPFTYQLKNEISTVGTKPKAVPAFGKIKGGNLPKVPKVFTVSMPPSMESKDESEEQEENPKLNPMATDEKDLRGPQSREAATENKSARPDPLQGQKPQDKADKSQNNKSDELQKNTGEMSPHQDGDHLRVSSPNKSSVLPSTDSSSSTKKQKSSSQLPEHSTENDSLQVIKWMKQKGLLRTELKCTDCSVSMNWTRRSSIQDEFIWKCQLKECTRYKGMNSIRKDAFFARSKISLQKWLHAIYLWCYCSNVEQTMSYLNLSKVTVIDIHSSFREVCTKHFEKHPIKLGGVGAAIQIDEACFSHKVKNNPGREPQEQIWVFGLVDTSTSPVLGYMEIVESHTAETLLPIIQKTVEPGSTIFSDEWQTYRNMTRNPDSNHETVNNSIEFANRLTGVHTQAIESYWNKHKYYIKKMRGCKREFLHSYLQELLWRERHAFDTFNSFCSTISELYPFQ